MGSKMKDIIGLSTKLVVAATAAILLSLWMFCGACRAMDTTEQLLMFGGKKWIQDLHNGIVNPNFTYTGGQSIIADENGILRTTPSGYPSVSGGKYVSDSVSLTYPTTATLRGIRTKAGTRQVVDSATFGGMLIEPAMTNKVTAKKANPTDTTNVSRSGDASAVLSVVADSTNIATDGLGSICTSGNVYRLDNSGGSVAANMYFGGSTGNTNKHTLSVYAKISGGTGAIFFGSGNGYKSFTNTSYSRIISANVTPSGASEVLYITVPAGQTIHVILPQVEESVFATSPIIGTDTAAAQTRQASVTSAPTPLHIFDSATTAQNFAIFQRIVPRAAGQTANIFSSRIDDNNLFKVSTTSTQIIATKTIASTATTATATYTHAAATPIDIMVIQSDMGMAIRTRAYSGGTWSAWSAWTETTSTGAKASAKIGSTYQIGALNSASQFSGNYPRAAIIKLKKQATLAEYEAWLIAEMTKRGLI